MNDDLIYGIDVSSWQGDIDLAALRPGFVLIRGVSVGSYLDEAHRLLVTAGWDIVY